MNHSLFLVHVGGLLLEASMNRVSTRDMPRVVTHQPYPPIHNKVDVLGGGGRRIRKEAMFVFVTWGLRKCILIDSTGLMVFLI